MTGGPFIRAQALLGAPIPVGPITTISFGSDFCIADRHRKRTKLFAIMSDFQLDELALARRFRLFSVSIE